MLELKARKPPQNYYKSKYHSQVEKSFNIQPDDPLEKKTEMYNKRWEYSTEIKTKFPPKVSKSKRKELKEMMEHEKINEKNKKRYSSIDPRVDGNKNLDRLHKYIAELKAKGKVRISETSEAH